VLASVALGTIVGILGAICLATSLVSIYQALSARRRIATELSPLLGLPLFYGGGSWAHSALIPASNIQAAGAGAYLASILATLLLVNAWPCFRLIVWAGTTIGAPPR
jgi:hypothetical protein